MASGRARGAGGDPGEYLPEPPGALRNANVEAPGPPAGGEVGRALILETTFLVDLEREIRRGDSGPAHGALQGHRDDHLYLTFTVAGELACGTSLPERDRWDTFLAPFHILPATREVCWQYGKAFRYLRDTGQLIGANDLWIASTALAYGMPVVTRNGEHFRRVPGVAVVEYRP